MTLRLSLLTLGLASWLTASAVAADDVEVLGRGPVHEAFAEPSEREPAPTPVIPKQPPKPIEELPPDQKPEGENVQWIPGYWQWDDDKKDFLWISGFWRVAPPGRTWVPGSWRQSGDGWQWTGGFWASAKDDKAELEYLPPPPAPLDNNGAATPAPSENHFYVPGSWVWRERYVWRPGFWVEHRPNWVWTSAHYRWTPGGYVFIDGYWDYPFASRGVLFAPVYIPPAVYTAPAYVYTPTVVVREECLYGAFFARRGFGCYYFGDYFAPRYASFGFTFWSGHVSASVSIGGWCDPLFSYYRCGYRHDPFWRAGVIDLCVGRYRGDYVRPPVNLVQQNTVINNITNNITNNTNIINNKTVIKNSNLNNVNLNNVQMLSSVQDASTVKKLGLQKVADTDRRRQQQSARELSQVAERRADLEGKLATRPATGGRPTPQSVQLEVPKPVARPAATTLPKGAASTPGTENLRPRPVTVDPPPSGPKPAAIGKVDPKPATVTPPKVDTKPATVAPPKVDIPRPAPPKAADTALPKIQPTVPKVGPRVEPKAPAAVVPSRPELPAPKAAVAPRPVPKVELPPAPKVVAPPAPKAAPPAKGKPATNPPQSSFARPSVSVPPATRPPVEVARPKAPAAPRVAPPAPARALPPSVSSPARVAPRVAPPPAPAVTRPAPVAPRPSAPPARPAPPAKKDKKDK
jgi:hypothetical protein